MELVEVGNITTFDSNFGVMRREITDDTITVAIPIINSIFLHFHRKIIIETELKGLLTFCLLSFILFRDLIKFSKLKKYYNR